MPERQINEPEEKLMKKALLYFPLDLVNNENSGIAKKCLGITHAFKQYYKTDVFTDAYGKVYFNGQLLKEHNNSGIKARLYNYNDIVFGQFNQITGKLRENKYDVLYFRFHYFLSWGMINFFRKIKKYNPSAKIYLELPCYPFEKEKGGSFLDKVRYWLNTLFTPLLKKYITKIVTFAELPQIWDVPAITISNGYYDPALQSFIDATPSRLHDLPENDFHIAMVARFTIGHAPEILISSLNQYYSSAGAKNVFVHLIGLDVNLSLCRSLVKEYALEEKIIFHGEAKTQDIVNILSKVHVCVGTLGLHRKEILIDSSLKSREYAAMGMPMILRTKDLDMLPSLFFVKYFPEPESLLDINEIMDFYEKLKETHPEYKKEIRSFARQNLTWSKKLEQVFEDIETMQKK
jgi:glycosyltransferase involved in cell wall biosynthesis